MSKIIIITADEQIKTIDYTGYRSIQTAVGGLFEHFYTEREAFKFRDVGIGAYDKIDFWCNDEGLCRDDIYKVNALATLLYNYKIYNSEAGSGVRQKPVPLQPIYGDICLTLTGRDGESRGFDYTETADCQCRVIQDYYRQLIVNNQNLTELLHACYDKQFPREYKEYVEKWLESHSEGIFDGMLPAGYEEWLDNEHGLELE